MFFLLPLMLMRRSLGSRNSFYDPSRELVLPKSIDRLFGGLLELERQFIKIGFRFPIGGSRLVVARLAETP